jgi:hypothetical protein
MARHDAGGWTRHGPAELGDRRLTSLTADPTHGVWVMLFDPQTLEFEIRRGEGVTLRPVPIAATRPRTGWPGLQAGAGKLYLFGQNGLWESPLGSSLSFTPVAPAAGSAFAASVGQGDTVAFLESEHSGGGAGVLVGRNGQWLQHPLRFGQGMSLDPAGWLLLADGPDLAVMAQLLAEHRPRLYVTVSVLHNPTGQTLSLAAAHQILKLAEQHDLTIVEDDTYAWLAPAHAPRLAALDGLQRTLYITGFSKILAPAWRVGVVAAAPALVERLIDSKLLGMLTTPALLERAVAWCLDQGLLRRHAERVVAQLDAARQRVVRLAQASGCRFVTPPQGLFGWVDTGVDTEPLAANLAAAGWLVAPGRLFLAAPRATTLMRVNFASAQDATFWHAFDAARQALASMPVR